MNRCWTCHLAVKTSTQKMSADQINEEVEVQCTVKERPFSVDFFLSCCFCLNSSTYETHDHIEVTFSCIINSDHEMLIIVSIELPLV
jgi:hypothetical protein